MKTSRLLTLASLAIAYLLSNTPVFGQSSPLSIGKVLSAPFTSDLVASPQGNRIAWLFDIEGKRNIWTAEAPLFRARQLTRYDTDDGQEITNLAFTHNGEWVIFVRGGDTNSAGDVPNPTNDPHGARQQLLAVSLKDGRTRFLSEGSDPVVSPTGDQIVFTKDNQLMVVSIAEGSEPHPLFAARGNNGSVTWSPDGKRIAFVSRRGTHSLIGVFDPQKETLIYVSPSVDRDSTPRWSPDGRRIAFVRQLARGNRPRPVTDDVPDPWAIVLSDLESRSLKTIWQSANDLNSTPPRMSAEFLLQWPLENQIVFASEMDGWMRLYSIPAQGGQAVALTPPSCEFENAAFTPDKRQIVYSSNCGDIDRRHIAKTQVSGGTPANITSGEGIESSPVVTGDGKWLFYVAADAKRPGMPFAMPFGGGERIAIAAETLPADYPASKLIVPKQVTFKSADGMTVHGQLFDAEPGSTSKRPAVIFMHGGPSRQMMLGWHNLYYYHNAYGFNQYLASRGYIVLSVNYRAGIMYGRAFREAPKRGARGAAEYQDVVAGAQYLRSLPTVDSTRIGLWGGSYGGYLTALGLSRNSDLFAAGVDIHGVHDWSLRISNSPWIDYNDRDAQKIARESSPMNSVSTWRSPVLLIHGDDDRNVAFAQTVELVMKLREQKVTFEQIVFPDEVHDFLLHRHWLQIYEASSTFLDRFLKNRLPAQSTQVDVKR
jgi:dipeptidyl aminopeptidase/acylaminoacyl peptidase